MPTSWAEKVLGEVIVSGEVCERIAKQADAAYLPIIARLVEAAQSDVEACACDNGRAVQAVLESISPADMAAIEEWKAAR